jgi:hypothetical protein
VCSLFPERLNGGEKAAVIGINVGTLSNGSNEIIAEPSEDKKWVLQSNTASGDWDKGQRD